MGEHRVWVNCTPKTSQRDLRDLAQLLLNRWESAGRPDHWDILESNECA
jgi:hypothetical protein